MYTETRGAYRGTSMEKGYRIFHDHLSSMWEGGAIEYMKTLGTDETPGISFWDRLTKITGSNNAHVTKYYQDSLPGNSPENARGTDSHAFADLMRIIMANISLTDGYDKDDPKKFSLNTPEQCYSSLLRAWTIVPDERFITDIMGWPAVLDKIIDAKGTKVEGELLRSGKRYIKLDGNTSKASYRSRDRKATLSATPIHEDSMNGFNHILDFGKQKFNEFIDAKDRAEANALRLEIEDRNKPDDEEEDAEGEPTDSGQFTVLFSHSFMPPIANFEFYINYPTGQNPNFE